MLRECIVTALLLSVAASIPQSSHTQFRRMTCLAESDDEPATCSLLMKQDAKDEEGETVAANAVCTTLGFKGMDEHYCQLYCNGAANAFLIAKRPSNNNKCAKFFSYKIVQRNTEWYLLRSGKCLKTEMQFDVGCQFNYSQSSAKSLKEFILKKVIKD